MAEFFKQLIAQLSAIWEKLSLQQKIITSSLIGFTLLALMSLMFWTQTTSKNSNQGFKQLYNDLPIEEVSRITEKLEKAGYKYKLENEGKKNLS